MKKKSIYFTLFFLISCLASFAQQCRLTYHVRQVDNFNKITFLLKNESITDSSGNLDKTITLDVGKEPEKIGIYLNDDYRHYNHIYLVDGKVEFTMNASITNLQFTNDLLNTHQQELFRQRNEVSAMQDKIDDQLESIDSLDPRYHILLKRYDELEDSLSDIYYESSLKYPGSFASLQYVKFSLGGKGYYNREKLSVLFQSLDYSLRKYPSWEQCHDVLQEKLVCYEVGDTLRSIVLKDSQGKESNLKGLLRKDFLYIDFWDSRCGAVPDAHDLLKKLSSAYSDYINVIGISQDEEQAGFQDYLKKTNLPWRNFCDYKGNLSPMYRHFGIGGTPRDVLINKNGIVIAKEFHVWDAADILSHWILVDARKTKTNKKETCNFFFKPKEGLLSQAAIAKLDSLIARLGGLLSFEIKINGYAGDGASYEDNVQLSAMRACIIKDYLLNHGIPSSRILDCKWTADEDKIAKQQAATKNPRKKYAEIVLEWAPGKKGAMASAPKASFNNPCEMFGDLRKVNDWKVGDSLFFCFLSFDKNPNGSLSIKNVPEVNAEINCLLAILKAHQDMKIEIVCIQCKTLHDRYNKPAPEYSDQAFTILLDYMKSNGLAQPGRIQFQKILMDESNVVKIHVPCTKRIYAPCLVWYMRVLSI